VRRPFSPKLIAWFVSLILAILIPPVFGGYLKTILILVCIWIIMGISLNLIYGYTGLLSLAQSAFFGIGAYSFALLTGSLGIPYWLAFFFSIVIVGIFAFFIGIPSLRLRGPYFILVSLSFAMIVHMIILAWDRLTGGANGISNIPRPPPLSLPFGAELEFTSLLSMYYLILLFLVVISLINYRLVNSLIGKSFIAISWDEDLTESLGINTMRCKLVCFIISSTFAAVAGILFASYNSVISPHIAHFTQGFNALVYVVIGGLATIGGPFIGSLVLVAVPELLQVVPELKTLIYGVVLVVFVIFMPSGIAGGFKLQLPTLAELTRRLKRIS
jgi:branched-chain amino acid transport system permease protein